MRTSFDEATGTVKRVPGDVTPAGPAAR
jgi:hypothetical protein